MLEELDFWFVIAIFVYLLSWAIVFIRGRKHWLSVPRDPTNQLYSQRENNSLTMAGFSLAIVILTFQAYNIIFNEKLDGASTIFWFLLSFILFIFSFAVLRNRTKIFSRFMSDRLMEMGLLTLSMGLLLLVFNFYAPKAPFQFIVLFFFFYILYFLFTINHAAIESEISVASTNKNVRRRESWMKK